MAAAPVALSYSIAASTPHSGPYRVENILVDNPTEQASRWSGGPVPETGTPQWLLLRLDTLAVVHSITFGKFANPHPCNMKNFKVFGGLSEDALTEVLYSELKNDTTPESFELKHFNDQGILTPFRYIKIMPLSSHGSSFHVSIWHVALKGIKDEVFVEQVRMKYDQYRETTTMRYVLKHLRQRRFLGPYNAILSRCGLQVEDPLVTDLHESVVLQGNWTKAEQNILRIGCRAGDVNGDVPPPRGGHAMCVDPVGGIIYLFGGWDGKKSLSDFWSYDIKQEKWCVLSYNTKDDENAPGARSCHKMVFDTRTGSIFVLGRLDDMDAQKFDAPQPTGDAPPPPPAPKPGPEFYRYDTRGPSAGQWAFLSTDPQAPHAPPLLYDHQMVMDSETQTLYVYGGRVIDGDFSNANAKYAGLYSYDVRCEKWQLLQISPPKPNAAFSGGIIPARSAHSMVLDDRTRTLYIFGGKTDSGTLSDMYTYHIATKTTRQVFADMTRDCGLGVQSSFQRAVIDPHLQEIYVFSGLVHETSRLEPQESSTRIFRYHPPPGKWCMIPTTKTIFMHGGNAGLSEKETADGDAMVDEEEERDWRLDDFWQMTLSRTPREEVVRRATLLVRKQQFREMCEDVSHVKALTFLRTLVFPVVDQDDPEETESYRGLLSYLFTPTSPVMSSHPHLKTPSSSSEHEDSPPRKRSRPNTPEDSEMTTPTDDVESPGASPVEAGAEAQMKILPFDVQLVRETEDPEERRDGGAAVSQTRFPAEECAV
ncbi:Muskelin-N domain-containing protein [Mycena sanguinolenta]|uniref:Muskelin-N domain-containing protein n=1 Tax=Mycena sanguinolenta TaxID=230812 RepID=A0A8H6ZFB8_9AGAR|nr:Muskelin-N domain-containing protein [Mycena sanguinolenta]